MNQLAPGIASQVAEQKVAEAVSPLQTRYADGAILAQATINGTASVPATYTTSPAYVMMPYNCASPTNEVKVKRLSLGLYAVSLPGISNGPGNTGRYVLVTGPHGNMCVFDPCTETLVNHASGDLFKEPGDGFIIVFSIQKASTGAFQDLPFSFAVLDYS